MGELEDRLENILNNPQAMSQIMSLAQSLGGGPPPSDPVSVASAPSDNEISKDSFPLDPKLINTFMALWGQINNSDDEKVVLLHSLKPFVQEKRYAKIDKAIQIVKLSHVARLAIDLFRSKEDDHV